MADEDPAPLGVVGMTPVEARERVTDFLRAAPVLSDIPVPRRTQAGYAGVS